MEEHHEEVPAKGSICGPKCKARYVMAIMGSVGMGLIYGMKVALHVTIVAMINSTATTSIHDNKSDSTSKCGFTKDNDTNVKSQDGPFIWDATVQGWLLSSYFLGYFVTQLPGGRGAELFSAKWMMFFAVALNIVAVLLSPIFSKLHWAGLLFLRILQGVGGGVTFPACHVLLSHWAPPLERSVMSSIVYAGTALGTVVFILVSGLIAASLGWEAVFYIEGSASAIWLLLWAWLISDYPTKQRLITPEERAFIVNSLGEEDEKVHPPVPWKNVFTSAPFWAILIAHTCCNWGWYMLLIELPLYMKNVLEFEISQNAVISSVPFLTMWLFSLILSEVLDKLMEKNKLTTTTARKIATLTATIIPIICLTILCFIECNRILAVTMMTVAVTGCGGMFSGHLANHLDIAPHYAGTLIAITNTAATIPGIVVPIVVGELTHQDPSIHSWRIVFYITIALYGVVTVVYPIFGSGVPQSWNKIH